MASKYYFDIEQNTPEWDELRKGKFTASNCPQLLMNQKNKGYKDLILRVAYERISGIKADSWNGNKSTERGHQLEPEAISEYEFLTGNKIQRVGFVELDEWTGCSPDGIVDEDTLIQIKCYEYKHQIDVLLSKSIGLYTDMQMQFEMYVTDSDHNVYFGYHPNLPEFMTIVERSEIMIDNIKEKLEDAKKEVQIMIDRIKNGN